MKGNPVQEDIQSCVNGYKLTLDVEGKIVTFSMILLQVMMVNKKRLTNLIPACAVKKVYEDKVYGVKHTAQNKAFFLCLNCAGWILRKNEILLPGWSLFDGNGHLKQNV